MGCSVMRLGCVLSGFLIVFGSFSIVRADASDGVPLAATSTSGTIRVPSATENRTNSGKSSIFGPYLDQIRSELPADWVMRLPSQLSFIKPEAISSGKYQVRVFQFTSPLSLTVGLFHCDTGSPDCLTASFAVESSRSTVALENLQQHEADAVPITLAEGILGYLRDGLKHQQPFSSVMWKQDEMVYTVTLPARERQNLLYTAVAMSNATPIRSTLANPVTPPVEEKQPQPTPSAPNQIVASNLVAPAIQAQNLPTQPERDRFVQPAPVPQPLPNERPVIPIPETPPETVSPTPADESPIPIRKIEVTGSSILSPQEISTITQPLEAKGAVTLQELNDAADKLTQLYLDRGYITSRAVPEEQTITNGVVQIRIIEGGIEQIVVEGTQHLNPVYVRSRVALGVSTPLNARRLEAQLRLLLADPLFKNVVPTLQAGTKEGQSILIVRVTEAPPFGGNVSFDNLSPPSVGSERAGINLRYRNLTGIGDEIAGSYYHTTTGGSDIGSLAYRVPLNPMEGSLQFRADINRNRITQDEFEELDIKGESELYQLSYRQPLIRSPQQEFALSLGFTYQDGQTFVFNNLPTPFGIGPDENGISRTSVITFGQDYTLRDPQGAWSFRSQFNIGTGLFNATSNPGAIPDSQFFSWLGQVQRVQRLSDVHLLITQLDLQLTPDSLLPSQQFVIGGGQSVRGYRQNARTGDNGLRFSVEDRITLNRDRAGIPTLQLAPFVDLGTVWNISDNPNRIPGQRFLIGAGLGVIWRPLTGLNLRLDYGIPFIRLDDRGNNPQDHGFHFTLDYGF